MRIVRSFAEHFGKIYVIKRKYLADYIKHPVGENGAHLLKLLQKPLKDAAFNDALAFFGFGGDEVESVALSHLTYAMDSPQPLFQPGRVPRQVVVDHQVAKLEVNSLACSFSCHADLARDAEIFLGLFALVRVHAAVDFTDGIAPSLQMLTEVFERVAVFGEDKQAAPAVV